MSVSLAKTPATIRDGRLEAAHNRALRSNDLKALAAEFDRRVTVITEGRYWLMDAVTSRAKGWSDLRVRLAVHRFYDGGWAAFSKDACDYTFLAR